MTRRNNPDRSIVLHMRSAPVDADPFDHDVIRSVNPALGIFLDESDYLPRLRRRGGCRRRKVRFAICGSINALSPHRARPTVDARGMGEGRRRRLMRRCSPTTARFMAASICRRAADLTALVWAVEDDDGIVHLLPRAWTPSDAIGRARCMRPRAL